MTPVLQAFYKLNNRTLKITLAHYCNFMYQIAIQASDKDG